MNWLIDFRVMMLVIEIIAVSTLDTILVNVDEKVHPISVPSVSPATHKHKNIKAKLKGKKSNPNSGLAIPANGNSIQTIIVLKQEDNPKKFTRKNYMLSAGNAQTMTNHKIGLTNQENTFKAKPKSSHGLTIPEDRDQIFVTGPVLKSLKHKYYEEIEEKQYRPARVHTKTIRKHKISLAHKEKAVKSKSKSSKGLTIPMDKNGISDAGPGSNSLSKGHDKEKKGKKGKKLKHKGRKQKNKQKKKLKSKRKSSNGLIIPVDKKSTVLNSLKYQRNKEKSAKLALFQGLTIPEKGFDQTKGFRRISIFDTSVLPNNGIETVNPEQMPIKGLIIPEDVNKPTQQQRELPRIPVFVSSNKIEKSNDGFYASNNSKSNQGLRRNQPNLSTGLNRIPIFDDESSEEDIIHDNNRKKPIKKFRSILIFDSEKNKLEQKIPKDKLQSKKKKKSRNGKYSDRFVHKDDDTSVADILANKIRVLCWVMTYPANHERAAKQVKRTWGRRCTLLLFITTEEDLSLPTVELPVKEGYEFIWGKTREAFKYIYEYHLNDAEWFLKADDDTYVILENLRYMLTKYNTNDPIYFGFEKRGRKGKSSYVDGGAGYVLSREAVTRFVMDALPDPYLCRRNYGTFAEDEQISDCLRNVGVKAVDTRDSYESARFFPCPPHHVIRPDIGNFWENSLHSTPKGLACCSEHAISFHHLQPNMMYVLEYFVYHLRPYGINYNFHFHIYHHTSAKNWTVVRK